MADNETLGLLTASTVPKEIWKLLEPWHSTRKVNFTQAFPRERVDGSTIVWRMISRFPGKENSETRKPRLRTSIKRNSQLINYDAQWQTITYQFDILDVSNDAVDILAEEWDSVVQKTVPFLMEKGVEHFLFSQQLQDETLQWARQDELHVRSFRYLCILPYYYVNTKQAIRDIYLNTKQDLIHECVPITRGSGTYDVYPDSDVDVVLSVHQLIGDDKQLFTPNVDYRVLQQTDSSCQLLWLQYGAQPETDEVYFVEVNRFRKSETTSTLGDTESPMP